MAPRVWLLHLVGVTVAMGRRDGDPIDVPAVFAYGRRPKGIARMEAR